MLAGAGLVRRPRNSSTSRTRAAPQVVPSSSALRAPAIAITSLRRIQHNGRPGARQRKRVQNSGQRRRPLDAGAEAASGWSARDSHQDDGGADRADPDPPSQQRPGPLDLPHRRRQDGHLRGRPGDHRLHRHARAAPRRRASCCVGGRLHARRRRPRARSRATLVEQARATAPAIVEIYDRAGEPADVPRRLQQLLRHRLRPHEHLRPRDRRAPAERARRRRPRRAPLRRAAQHRLRHVVRVSQRHRVAALVPRELPGDGRQHDQADGDDLRARRRPRP